MIIKPLELENLKQSHVGSGDGEFSAFIQQQRPAEDIPEYSKRELEEALEKATQEAHEKAYQQGLQEGQGQAYDVNEKLSQALATLTQQFEGVSANLAQQLEQSREETTSLASTIAKVVAGKALEDNALKNIEAMVERCINILFGTTALTIFIHPHIREALNGIIEDLTTRYHFQGEVIIKDDSTMSPQDIRIEWQHGGASLNQSDSWSQVEAILSDTSLPTAMPHDTSSTNTAEPDNSVQEIDNSGETDD